MLINADQITQGLPTAQHALICCGAARACAWCAHGVRDKHAVHGLAPALAAHALNIAELLLRGLHQYVRLWHSVRICKPGPCLRTSTAPHSVMADTVKSLCCLLARPCSGALSKMMLLPVLTASSVVQGPQVPWAAHTLAATSPCTITSQAPPALAPGSGVEPAAAAKRHCSAVASSCGSSKKVSAPTIRVTRCGAARACLSTDAVAL